MDERDIIRVQEIIRQAEETVAMVTGRLGFPPGEWDGEPDYLKWRDEESGLLCIVRRNSEMGNLNGYVRVPRGHPFYRRQYSSLRIARSHRFKTRKDGSIFPKKTPPARACPVQRCEVHGGITFSGRLRRYGGGIERGWWFGFDTAHAWDLSPRLLTHCFLSSDSVYRNFNYVRMEVISLARQIAQAAR